MPFRQCPPPHAIPVVPPPDAIPAVPPPHLVALEMQDKKFDIAIQYYQQALLLSPSSGSPHNQLAVVATYSCDLFSSAYHYARASMTDSPYPRAEENLRKLFGRAKQEARFASHLPREPLLLSGCLEGPTCYHDAKCSCRACYPCRPVLPASCRLRLMGHSLIALRTKMCCCSPYIFLGRWSPVGFL